METPIFISLFYTGLLALLYFVLSVGIIKLRWRDRVAIGTGDSKDLNVAVRIHGNFSEYVPLLLIGLLMMELTGADPMMLHGVGAALFISRILHAVGLNMTVGSSKPRFVGVLLTFVVLLVEAGYMMGYGLGAMWS